MRISAKENDLHARVDRHDLSCDDQAILDWQAVIKQYDVWPGQRSPEHLYGVFAVVGNIADRNPADTKKSFKDIDYLYLVFDNSDSYLFHCRDATPLSTISGLKV